MGDTDDSGKGRHFKSRFIQPGVAGYPGQFGNVLITKESLDKFINTMVGVPVIINHKDLTDKNVDDERVGVVNSVWYDNKDGWYWCDGIIWNETAQNLITDKNWSVSCSYDVKTANDEGGSENNIKYDMEFLDGVFTHLALVNNPRYERANIVFNSKTVIENGGQGSGNPYQKRNELGQWCKDYNAMAQDVKSYCENKGFIVEQDNSKSTNSIYLKLYKNDKDLNNHTYYKAIRLSDHESEQGDKDIMLKYSDNLEDIKRLIDENLSNKVDEDTLKDFKGVIIDYNKIHPELNFEGLEIPQIKKQIENFYNKYLKTFNKSENTLNLSKDGIDLGFSNRFLNVLTTHKDFKLVQVLLSNIEDIVDKGKLETISQHKKRLKTPIFDDNTFYNLELPIEQDNRGNWVIDVLKMNINNSQGTKGKPSPQSLTANNIINDVSNNFNPNVKENEEMNVENGWITTDRVDENGERIKVWIEGASAQPKIYKDWTKKTRNEFLDAERKDGVINKPKFEYRSKVSDEDKKIIESTFNKLYSEYKMRPVAGIGVMQLAEGTLGVCNAMPPHKYTYIKDGESEKGESKGVSTIALNSQMTRGKYTEEDWQRSKESRFHPDTEGGMLENVLTHEFAHAITANNRDDAFWVKITKIRTEYMKNVEKSDINNPDYVSKYARENKDEFVAECFTQAKLSKKPSKYAKEVLDVINEHYAGGKTAQNSLFNSKEEQIDDAEEWIEAYGLGYPICEEAYEEFKKDEDKKQKTKANNDKEQEMALIEELKKLITKVENDKGEKDMEIENAKVDKRKLIDEVGGILKGKVDDEIIRTIIGKLEKVAYDESEAGTADNEKEEDAKNCKAKNEDDEKEVEEVKEEVKEDVENCGKKGKVENAKEDYFAKLGKIANSVAKAKEETSYVSRADREKAAEDYFRV